MSCGRLNKFSLTLPFLVGLFIQIEAKSNSSDLNPVNGGGITKLAVAEARDVAATVNPEMKRENSNAYSNAFIAVETALENPSRYVVIVCLALVIPVVFLHARRMRARHDEAKKPYSPPSSPTSPPDK